VYIIATSTKENKEKLQEIALKRGYYVPFEAQGTVLLQRMRELH